MNKIIIIPAILSVTILSGCDIGHGQRQQSSYYGSSEPTFEQTVSNQGRYAQTPTYPSNSSLTKTKLIPTTIMMAQSHIMEVASREGFTSVRAEGDRVIVGGKKIYFNASTNEFSAFTAGMMIPVAILGGPILPLAILLGFGEVASHSSDRNDIVRSSSGTADLRQTAYGTEVTLNFTRTYYRKDGYGNWVFDRSIEVSDPKVYAYAFKKLTQQ
jgi:hypothetical protein